MSKPANGLWLFTKATIYNKKTKYPCVPKSYFCSLYVNRDRTNWKLLQSRISDISEGTKIESFPWIWQDSSTKKSFSFVKLTVTLQSGVARMEIVVCHFPGLVIGFMHDHHPPSPDVRRMAECSRKSGVEKGKNTEVEGGYRVHSPLLKKDPLINHEHQFWTLHERNFNVKSPEIHSS